MTSHIGTVELKICKAIAAESIEQREHPGMTMRRYGYHFQRHADILEAVNGFVKELRSPPPSPARQRAMNSQLAKINSQNV